MGSRKRQYSQIFNSGECSVFYRQAQALKWQNNLTPRFSLFCLLDGQVNYMRGGSTHKLSRSHLLFLKPREELLVMCDKAEFLFVTISPAVFAEHAAMMQLFSSQSTVAFPRGQIHLDQPFNRLLKEFVAEFKNEEAGTEIVISALLRRLIVFLLRAYLMERDGYASVWHIKDRRIRRAVEIMHDQMDQALSLNVLAGAAYLSPFHFARLFKKVTGYTPHNYLASIRVSRAKTLLAQADLSVTEVGIRVGYLSVSHFTKAFRQVTGISPRAFRDGHHI